ncbi:cell division protein FtsQ/DivIB [Lactobacillus sp. PSON]|uniref:cell division protein FtsQ/DivIB n=1 Tax=Lactobacillus sp. PSON TaxID=3455454 RepID=UPI00404165DE
MPRKRVTKIDPRKELSPYINHQTNQSKKRKRRKNKKAKVSASLSGLHKERRKSLFKRLGLIVLVSLIAIICLGYYISPYANISGVSVKGATGISSKEIVKNSGIKARDKVFDYIFNKKNLDQRLTKRYPEIKSVNVKISNVNQLVLEIHEYGTLGYIKSGSKYKRILSNGKIGTQLLTWNEIQQDKPLFIGYKHNSGLKDELKLFNDFPQYFKDEVKVLSGNTRRPSQIVLVMKDGNVVIGNITTLKNKIKYYNAIKQKADKHSLIDLEVGAFSRPLTTNEMKTYGIS